MKAQNESTEDSFFILIVDDNPQNLQVLGKLLLNENYKLEFAVDGETALSWVECQEFDLILLDIMMPGMSGIEVCKKLQESEKHRDIPVIFLSADTDKETILSGFDTGGRDYVTKPFDARELMARVKTHLELKRSKEQLKKINIWLEDKVNERTEQLKNANEKLAKANAELLALDQLKDDFLNLISHEIRTPLNGIMGSVELLKHKSLETGMDKYIQMLDISVSRLEKFSLNALTITELQAGKRKIFKKEINLKEVIQNAIEEIKIPGDLKKIKFQIQIPSSGLFVHADEDLIEKSVVSILKNAVHYSPEKGTIKIQASQNSNNVYCEFLDEGPGFSQLALDNLFKLFVPGEPHIDKNVGMELNLTKLIMEAHKGTIQVKNLQNQGAMVKLTFCNA